MAPLLIMCLLLPLALFAQAWASKTHEAGRLHTLWLSWPSRRAVALALVGFLGIVAIAAAASTAYNESAFLFDDSFISFRYSKNLALGHGLRWNPDETPSEGYTNFLLVLLVAPVIGFGGDPLLASRIISGVSIAIMMWVVFRIARRENQASSPQAVIAALAILTSGLTVEVAMLGLETVPFTAALLVTYDFSERFFETERSGWMLACGAVAFAAFLLRPEVMFLLSAILVAAIGTTGLRPGAWRRACGLLSLSFGPPMLIYLTFKLFYFGSIVPNPALVKVSGGTFQLLGIESVRGFLNNHFKLVLLAGVGLVIRRDRWRSALTAALLVATFLIFFARVETLMDTHNRFLYPIFPFLLVLALPALAALVQRILDWQQAALLRVMVGATLLLLILYANPGDALGRALGRTASPVTKREVHQASTVLWRIGRALATYPRISEVTIGSGDAGLLPYASGARHVDMAGLATRFLAEHKDPHECAEYFFGTQPDLIILRARIGGLLVNYDHGVLGDYTRWSSEPGWDLYEDAGGIHNGPRHDLHFFLRKGSQHERALREILRAGLIQADVAEMAVPMGTAAQK